MSKNSEINFVARCYDCNISSKGPNQEGGIIKDPDDTYRCIFSKPECREFQNYVTLLKISERERTEKSDIEIIDEKMGIMDLLSLPDHLRKTAVTLCKLEKANAEEVAKQTKRARAVESGYLNQLVIMGYLKKERSKRKAYFYADKR
ncbi:MAG: hypothetical protein ABIE55_00830 [Candidatus Aenigmatarchaeota archaeon]